MTDVLLLIVPLALVLVATLCDLRTRQIPDWISLVLLAWGLTATALEWHERGWWSAAGGLTLGLTTSGIVFALGGMGGGDVKLLAALGAAIGPLALLQTFFWMALAGGVLALIAAARGKKDLAYGPAIAVGFVMYLALPSFPIVS